MVTHARPGIYKPNPKYALEASVDNTISPVPRSVRFAIKDPNWYPAMKAEFDALQANKTWSLVSRPRGTRLITGKWVFKHKMKPDGTLERYKAQWVVRGFYQCPGIDFRKTFSPVIKPSTIRTVLTLIASKGWPAHQLDVSNAFLPGAASNPPASPIQQGQTTSASCPIPSTALIKHHKRGSNASSRTSLLLGSCSPE
jgi:hypothetical protein